jgi:hypothetical protein
MSWRLPIASTQQLWIMTKLAAPISIVSPAIAMIEAADAAMPMILTVTSCGCSRSTLKIAMPSNMSPPGELICTSTGRSPIARSCAATFFAVIPPPVQKSSPITSNMVMTLSPVAIARTPGGFLAPLVQHVRLGQRADVPVRGHRQRARARFGVHARAAAVVIRDPSVVIHHGVRVERRVVVVAALDRVHVLEAADVVLRQPAAIAADLVRAVAGLQVRLDEGRAIEAGIDEARADQVSVTPSSHIVRSSST